MISYNILLYGRTVGMSLECGGRGIWPHNGRGCGGGGTPLIERRGGRRRRRLHRDDVRVATVVVGR